MIMLAVLFCMSHRSSSNSNSWVLFLNQHVHLDDYNMLTLAQSILSTWFKVSPWLPERLLGLSQRLWRRLEAKIISSTNTNIGWLADPDFWAVKQSVEFFHWCTTLRFNSMTDCTRIAVVESFVMLTQLSHVLLKLQSRISPTGHIPSTFENLGLRVEASHVYDSRHRHACEHFMLQSCGVLIHPDKTNHCM